MALGTTRGAVLIPSIASHQLRSSLGDPAAPAPAPALARDQLEQTRSGVPFRASPQPRPLSRPQAPTAELTQQPDIVLLSSDDESDLTSVEEWDGHETQRGSPARGGAHADATVPDPLPDDTNGLAHIADERQRGRERVSGIGGASRPASTLNVGDDVGATTTPDVGIGTLHDGRRLTNLGLERVSYEPVATVIQPPSDSAQAQGQVPVQTPTVVGASRLPEAISISDDDDDDEVASATETTHAQPTTFPAVNFETAHLNPAFPFLAVPPPPMPTTLASTSLLPTSAFPAISGPQASQAPANMNITASMSTSAAPLAQRDNDLVCLGEVHCDLELPNGMPPQVLYDPAQNVAAQPVSVPDGLNDPEAISAFLNDEDSLYTPQYWYRMPTFWAMKGTRPAQLYRQLPRDSGQNEHSLGTIEPPLEVALIIPPALRPWRPELLGNSLFMSDWYKALPPSLPGARSSLWAPFGRVTPYHASILNLLMKFGGGQFECRVRMVNVALRHEHRHRLQIMVHLPSRHLNISRNLIQRAGMTLTRPTYYSPFTNSVFELPLPPITKAPTAPFPPATFPATAPERFTLERSARPIGVGMDPLLTEQAQRQLLDQVYASLAHAEDVQEVEPCELIQTPLFPHQKKALGFLLMREEGGDFDMVARNLHEGAMAEAKKPTKTPPSVKQEIKDKDPAEEENSVSLWRPVVNDLGAIKGYQNLVTHVKVKQRPSICRGAILADDMGLGKTISVIALMAHTRSQALVWAETKPNSGMVINTGSKGGEATDTRDTAVVLDSSSDDSDLEFRGMRHGNQGGKRRAMADPEGAGSDDVVTRQRRLAEQERVRRANLRLRSRATLIVCPMSIIANWRDQLGEHWARSCRPKIDTYHGARRSTNLKELADNDVVLTTYSTLAAEFGTQSLWTDSAVYQRKPAGQLPHDAQTDVGGKRKREKNGKRKPHLNPLQRIEWFRIVLDEAHIIKDCTTLQSRAVCNLSAQRRLALTGTPIQNAALDLYALVRFLRLEPFSDRAEWNYWCNVSRAGLTLSSARKVQVTKEDTVSLARIQTIMKYLTLRRTKETRGPDGKTLLSLPPRHAMVSRLSFSEKEKARYLTLHESYKGDFAMMAEAAQERRMFPNERQSGQSRLTMNQILKEIAYLRLTCDHSDMPDQGVDQQHGDLPIEEMISQHGITADRARKLVQVWHTLDAAQCSKCEEEVGDLEGRRPRAVVTRCQHLFCEACFTHCLPPGSSWPNCKANERILCPECGQQVQLVIEAMQVDCSNLDGISSDSEHEKEEKQDPLLPGRENHRPFRRRMVVDSDSSQNTYDEPDTDKAATTGDIREAGQPSCFGAQEPETHPRQQFLSKNEPSASIDAGTDREQSAPSCPDRQGLSETKVSDKAAYIDEKNGDDSGSSLADLSAVMEDCFDPCRFLRKRASDSKSPRNSHASPKGSELFSKSSHLGEEVPELSNNDSISVSSMTLLDSTPTSRRSLPQSQADVALRAQAARLRSCTLDEAQAIHPDFSTKILALLQDLIPFSMCNPESRLYDPQAPKLDHIPTSLSEQERLQVEREQKVKENLSSQQQAKERAQERLSEIRARQARGSEVDAHEVALLEITAEQDVSQQEAEAEVPAVPTVQVGTWSGKPGTYRPIKSVVFSEWTRMLDKIGNILELVGIRTARLDGRMSREARTEALHSFHDPGSTEVLLISLRSGGVGLNLGADSSRAYLVEPAWNPAVEQQALDRIYRLGQQRPVITVKLVMRHSIEENLLLLQARKHELAQSIGARRPMYQEKGNRPHDLQRLFGSTHRLREDPL